MQQKAEAALARDAQLLMDRKDDTKRAYAAWVAAQHAEEQQHHALRVTLAAYKSAVDCGDSGSVRLQSGIVVSPAYVGPDRRGASLPPNPTPTVLPQFNGVRD